MDIKRHVKEWLKEWAKPPSLAQLIVWLLGSWGVTQAAVSTVLRDWWLALPAAVQWQWYLFILAATLAVGTAVLAWWKKRQSVKKWPVRLSVHTPKTEDSVFVSVVNRKKSEDMKLAVNWVGGGPQGLTPPYSIPWKNQAGEYRHVPKLTRENAVLCGFRLVGRPIQDEGDPTVVFSYRSIGKDPVSQEVTLSNFFPDNPDEYWADTGFRVAAISKERGLLKDFLVIIRIKAYMSPIRRVTVEAHVAEGLQPNESAVSGRVLYDEEMIPYTPATRDSNLSDADLGRMAAELASEIGEFLAKIHADRPTSRFPPREAPERVKQQLWQDETDRMIRQGGEQLGEYMSRFHGRAMFVATEAVSRGYLEEQDVQRIRHPVNPFGFRDAMEKMHLVAGRTGQSV